MARGWESKAIEAQQEAATERHSRRPARTPGELARQSQRDTLALARTKALSELQHACSAAHRGMLEQMIAELDRQINVLDSADM